MNISRTAVALAAAMALTGLNAHAQTTRGVAPAGTPESGQTGTMTQPDARTNVDGARTNDARTNDARTNAPGTNGAEQQSQLNQEDRSFLENAIQGSYAEIEGSQLALEKTESQDVKQFAEMMIKDHGMMVKEATKLAQEKGLTPPDGPSMMQTTEITALKALTGGAFDAMYVNRIGVASHEATVEMFEEATQQASDPDVKAMATKTLPKLREHLEMAQALDKKQDKQ